MVLMAVCLVAAGIAADKALLEDNWEKYGLYYDQQDQHDQHPALGHHSTSRTSPSNLLARLSQLPYSCMVLMAVCDSAATIAAGEAKVTKRWDKYQKYYDFHDQELAERSSKVRHLLFTQ